LFCAVQSPVGNPGGTRAGPFSLSPCPLQARLIPRVFFIGSLSHGFGPRLAPSPRRTLQPDFRFFQAFIAPPPLCFSGHFLDCIFARQQRSHPFFFPFCVPVHMGLLLGIYAGCFAGTRRSLPFLKTLSRLRQLLPAQDSPLITPSLLPSRLFFSVFSFFFPEEVWSR